MGAIHSRDAFLPGSSELDWCEPNYVVSNYIAEFYNTISNVLFFIYPPILMMTFTTYAERVTPGCHLVWILFIIVGIGSVYFHATLSLFGQLLDEMCILWIFCSSMTLWVFKRFVPVFYKHNRSTYYAIILTGTLTFTYMSTYFPVINNVALFCLSAPVTYGTVVEIRRCNYSRIRRLGYRWMVVWPSAVLCWLTDRLMCDFWTSVNFPYFHSIWHLLVAVAAVQVCILLAYFDIASQKPDCYPVLKYFPYDSWEVIGVPYITFKDTPPPKVRNGNNYAQTFCDRINSSKSSFGYFH